MNFLPQNNRTGFLKIAIGACLGVSAVMVWAMIWGPGSGSRTANISSDVSVGESLSTPLPRSAPHVPKLLGNNPVISITQGLGTDTVRYYERETGRSFQVRLDTGKTETLSDTPLNGFVRTYWAPSKMQVVSVFEESNGLHFRSYDYTTNYVSEVGTSATSAVFSPSGRRLAFVNTQDTTATLLVANPDGTDSRTILNTRGQEVVVQWPQEEIVSMFSRRPDQSGADLSLIDTNGNLSVLLNNKENLEYVWSPSGKKVLFSYFVTGQGIQLWSMDTASKAMQSLGVATSAAKCAWSGNETVIVCGVPATTSLSRDVTADKSATLDDIVSIDLATGIQNTVYTGTKNALIGIGESFVSSSGNYFVFTNIFNHRLYRMEIASSF